MVQYLTYNLLYNKTLNQMTIPSFRDKITQIFVSVDDFCLEFEKPVKQPTLKEETAKPDFAIRKSSPFLSAFTAAGSATSNFITPTMFVCI